MAALDFPDAPTPGQVFDKWTWNGTMWVLTPSATGGGSGFTFNQDAMPTATKVGDTWYETDTGDSFVWTNDGNSTQWVQFAPGSGGGGGSGYTYVTDTAPTPSRVGETWFDSSLGASGGTSWVAIEEGAVGSEKVWVQTSPGAGGSVSQTEWIAHDPILAQGAAATNIGKTVTYSRYTRSGPTGKTVTWNFRITAAGAGSNGSVITLSMPTAAVDAMGVEGPGAYFHSPTWTPGTLLGYAVNTVQMLTPTGPIGSGFAVVSGDQFAGSITYEST